MRKTPAFLLSGALATALTIAALPATASDAGNGEWTQLKSAPAPISNPLKGFFPFAPDDGSELPAAEGSLPYTMEWTYFPVSDVVTAKGVYDWSKVDKMLDAIASRGHQAVFRFYLDYPTRKSGVPQYLIDEGINTSRTYTVFDNNRVSFSPDYNDPRIQEMMLDFVKALGEKYDGDARVGYLTAGLIGFWGEDHTWPMNGEVSADNPKGENWMPSDEFRAKLVAAWDSAFNDTHILYRLPTEATKAHHMGYHDDSFAYSTLDNVDWHFMAHMKNQGEDKAWQNVPIGGEVYPPLQTCIFSQPLNCPGAEAEKAQGRNFDMVKSIEATHVTWLINHKAFLVGYKGADLERAKEANALMGYTLSAKKARTTVKDSSVTVEAEIANTGLAPFYANWPIEVALVNSKGEKVVSKTIESPLPSVEPGSSTTVEATLDLSSGVGERAAQTDSAPVSGDLTAVLRVVNPLPNGAPVAFANEAMGTTLPGYLSLGTVSLGSSLPAQPSTPKGNESSTPGGSTEAKAATASAEKQSAEAPKTKLASTGTVGGAVLAIAAGALGLGALLIRRTHA